MDWNRSNPDGEIYRFTGKARYVPTTGSITVGSGNAALNFVIQYNGAGSVRWARVPAARHGGATFGGSPSIRTDRRGYAVVPYLQPYRQNWLNIDPSSVGTDTEITDNAKMVVPMGGAIVKTRFEAESGRRVQFERSQDEGARCRSARRRTTRRASCSA
nr:fimbria/pilus outer membrane usher protein [Burkholderia cepacia]